MGKEKRMPGEKVKTVKTVTDPYAVDRRVAMEIMARGIAQAAILVLSGGVLLDSDRGKRPPVLKRTIRPPHKTIPMKKPVKAMTPMTPQEAPAFEFPVSPGIYRTLKPINTCEGINPQILAGNNYLQKYGEIIGRCGGRMQQGGNTFLRTTIPGYKANSQLFVRLENAFLKTGQAEGLPKVAKRTFIFHREDGLDGLRGGNLESGTKSSMTSVQPGVSESFTSIPLNGDNVGDIGALATEICQTHLMAEKDALKAENIANSFGVAVRSAYSGWDYEKYSRFVDGAEYLIYENDKDVHRLSKVSRETYRELLDMFKDKPDILVKHG